MSELSKLEMYDAYTKRPWSEMTVPLLNERADQAVEELRARVAELEQKNDEARSVIRGLHEWNPGCTCQWCARNEMEGA